MTLVKMQDLYVNQLRDLYSAERQLLMNLPHMVQAAAGGQLAIILADYVRTTMEQTVRLEELCKDIEVAPTGNNCMATEGLIDEVNLVIQSAFDRSRLEVAIVALAQRLGLYQLAAYKRVRTFAAMLGHHDAAEVLQEAIEDLEITCGTWTRLVTSGSYCETVEIA